MIVELWISINWLQFNESLRLKIWPRSAFDLLAIRAKLMAENVWWLCFHKAKKGLINEPLILFLLMILYQY